MKRHLTILLQGLALTIPVIVTIYILYATVSWLDGSVREAFGDLNIPGLGLILAVVILYCVGLLSHFLLFRRFVDVAESAIGRVPLVKTVYGSVRDLMGFLGPKKNRPSGVAVRVNVTENAHIIGVRTTDSEDGTRSAVYLPFSYMLGGFLVFFPKERIEPVDMSVEEALKFAITGGMGGGVRDASAEHEVIDVPGSKR